MAIISVLAEPEPRFTRKDFYMIKDLFEIAGTAILGAKRHWKITQEKIEISQMLAHLSPSVGAMYHHISNAGIERRKIFNDNQDRDNFFGRLATLLPETNITCYAWAFLSNHAHFLFRTGDIPLSTLMRRLLTWYAVSFNLRHKRHGQLFARRMPISKSWYATSI